MRNSTNKRWILVDPTEPLPCMLGVVVPESNVEKLREIEQESCECSFYVRAVLSDHIPLSGSMEEILARPSYHRLLLDGKDLTIYLHRGGGNAVFFDLVRGSDNSLEYVGTEVISKYPSNCMWAARTAISGLLDSMLRQTWLPLTIRRLDVYYEDDELPLCHQLILPFTDGVCMRPFGGFHQYSFMAPYEALVREAIVTASPYYRLLCAYRLYEGVQLLRRKLREFAESAGVELVLPKPQLLDLEWLKQFGIRDEFLVGLKNIEDFWQKTRELRNGASHFLLNKSANPISFSDGATYQAYSIVGALLLHYAHTATSDLTESIPIGLHNKLLQGSILPLVENRKDFRLKPD